MNKLKVLSLATIFTVIGMTTSVANAEAVKADQEMLNDIFEICQSDAQEDEVGADMLVEYIVQCITEDLEANNFEPISKAELVKFIQTKLG
ncbi:hypothetical protein [Colwellia sp. MEBiC06753]